MTTFWQRNGATIITLVILGVIVGGAIAINQRPRPEVEVAELSQASQSYSELDSPAEVLRWLETERGFQDTSLTFYPDNRVFLHYDYLDKGAEGRATVAFESYNELISYYKVK